MPKDATEATKAANANAAQKLNFATDDFELASRGYIATHPTGVIEGPFGVARDLNEYSFLDDPTPPPTVEPSLWRQARLNNICGLFKVDEGLWQVRGFDISVITFIAGDTGWIIIDPLTSPQTARAALDLANEHLGERPVKAVIYTHSHSDHYGGIKGVTTIEAVENGEVEIIAPVGFMREVVGESLIGGNAMFRRSGYQFGIFLPPGPKQHVDAGLGKCIVKAPPGLIGPTREILATGEEAVIDGIRIVFQNTPDSEAPAEMNFYFPDRQWLCTAENCTHTMHNLIPFRGAKARDTLAWSKYIDEALAMFAPDAKLVFASHHWPRWGNEAVVNFLERQRDMYRWIHDQTMRLASKGLTANEIAEELVMPEDFCDESHTRGYYGSLIHNVKAVYQLYLSWYDANPAHLWPHPPVEAGKRYVEFMGGANEVLRKARESFDAGDYRWVCEVVNHLVFADPTNDDARALGADSLEQLGYQSESATWRNAYLTGAHELRNGAPGVRKSHRRDLVEAVNLAELVDTMGIRLLSDNVGGLSSTLRIVVTKDGEQTGDSCIVSLSRRTLFHRDDSPSATVDATLAITMADLVGLAIVETTFDDLVAANRVEIDAPQYAKMIFDNLEVHQTGFNIVVP